MSIIAPLELSQLAGKGLYSAHFSVSAACPNQGLHALPQWARAPGEGATSLVALLQRLNVPHGGAMATDTCTHKDLEGL